MAAIRRLVLDVLKPHEPGIVPFTEHVSDIDGVTGVTGKLVEIDENVRTIRLAIEGPDLDLELLRQEISDQGGSIHSVDEVSCGEEVVDDPWLTQP